MRKTGKMTKILAGVILGLGLLTSPALAVDVPQEINAPYTIDANHWSREDFSQAANPAVFTEVFDRDLYNAIRQTLGDGDTENAKKAYTMVSQDNYSQVKRLLDRMAGDVWYKSYVPTNLMNYWQYPDYFSAHAERPEHYADALKFIQPVIDEVKLLETDAAKITFLNDYLCTLLEYKKGTSAGVPQIFSEHSAELNGNCSSYSWAFQFLCSAADIPSFTITSQNHAWNMVYVDGRWVHVDVSANDHYKQKYILMKETVDNRIDENPAATAFLQELLVPGSTK